MAYPNVVILSRVVKFRQTPIYQSEKLFLMVHDDILGFDISMHDSARMAIIQSLLRFEKINAKMRKRSFTQKFKKFAVPSKPHTCSSESPNHSVWG